MPALPRVDAVLAANRPVGNYWLDISTLAGDNSPAIIHYEGAPNPLNDTKFLATRKETLGCKSGVGGQPGVLDLKNASFSGLLSVGVSPKVVWLVACCWGFCGGAAVFLF